MVGADCEIERKLAEHVARLSGDALAPPAAAAFDRLLEDFVAVVLAGLNDVEARHAARTFARLGGKEESSVAGCAVRVPAPSAAFAHGALAHWFDWDDTHDSSHVHGGAVILPCLIALSEAEASSDHPPPPADFVGATVAAYDVACRLGGFLKEYSHRGWMPTGSGATIAAAAAGARLIGLDEGGVLAAMGIAASNAGLSRQALADRTNGKGILAGIAAKTAIEAALLARHGIVGAPHFLTGMYGLHALHGGGRGDPALMLAGLGTRFSVTEVSTKPYPCCRSTHAVVDSVLAIRQSEPTIAGRVKAMEITVPRGAYERCGADFRSGDNPRLAAQFSLAYTAALALHRGVLSLADFAPAEVLRNEHELGDLIGAVMTKPDELAIGDSLAPATVRLITDRGVIERTATVVRGAPGIQSDEGEGRSKLRRAASNLSSDRCDHIEALILATREQGPGVLMAELRGIQL